MSSPEAEETTGTPRLRHPNVRLMVRDFGPLAKGEVELRPLTVFVGPSNTGKTYLAILMYALHRVSGGFPRLPLFPFPYGSFRFPFVRGRRALVRGRRVLEAGRPESREVLQRVLDKLSTEGRPFKLSDLPESLREAVESNVNDPDVFGAELTAELQRCFDLESVSEMIRHPRRGDARISLEVSDEEQKLWQFDMGASPEGSVVNGRVEDTVLLYGGRMAKKSRRRWFERFRSLVEADGEHPFLLEGLLELISHSDENTRARDTFYLPAVRGGIMQSHRVIASALVSRSTRAGFERIPQIPTFSGGVADFMQRLILYDEDEATSERVAEMAGALENETLAGQILTTRSIAGGYPEFVYRPRETEQDIRLTRASSMVSELAPVVLFLRGIVSPGDTFIIEEPEAHLHPAAQTQMAMTLARLVRAGVRVVVTTHSDWLLQEIANLMREGEMEGPPDASSSQDLLPAWLRPQEVGIWLFSREREAAGSTVEEIPFDRVEGVEPRDYEEVAEALYNRSAELQNRLAEAERGERNDHE